MLLIFSHMPAPRHNKSGGPTRGRYSRALLMSPSLWFHFDHLPISCFGVFRFPCLVVSHSTPYLILSESQPANPILRIAKSLPTLGPMVPRRVLMGSSLMQKSAVYSLPPRFGLIQSYCSSSNPEQSANAKPDGSNKNQRLRGKVTRIRYHDQAMFNRFQTMKQVCGSLKLKWAARLLAFQFKYDKIFFFFKLLLVSFFC